MIKKIADIFLNAGFISSGFGFAVLASIVFCAEKPFELCPLLVWGILAWAMFTYAGYKQNTSRR